MSTATAQVGVRERPIPFSGEMIRAILDGRKTQTRRVLKQLGSEDSPTFQGLREYTPGLWGRHFRSGKSLVFPEGLVEMNRIRCPYGQPGDRLWVREPLRKHGDDRVLYVADDCVHPDANWPWRVKALGARYMPRGLSRLTLEITDVRVERLQEITSRGAYAEGAPVYPLEASYAPEIIAEIERLPPEKQHMAWRMAPMREDQPPTPKQWFRDLWDRLNSIRGYGWDANPWVWVVSFRRVDS